MGFKNIASYLGQNYFYGKISFIALLPWLLLTSAKIRPDKIRIICRNLITEKDEHFEKHSAQGFPFDGTHIEP